VDSDLASRVAAEEIFGTLVEGKHFDRELAQARIESLGEPGRAELRARIVASLPALGGDENIWTRSWLLSSLGRVADNDETALDTLMKRVSDFTEEAEWARYWALEGAVAGSVPTLGDLAQVAKKDLDDLPKYLGLAVAASFGSDEAAMEQLLDALKSEDLDVQWLALRGLRVAPVLGLERFVVAILEEDLEKDSFDHATYQAVVALGAIPPGSGRAVETAAFALQRLVVDRRNDLMWSEARARALNGLGRLQFPSSAPTLVNELLDGNPATVREAAIALEAVLGTDRSVDRVVEAAGATDEADVVAYAQALRWMDRKAVAERLEQSVVSGQGNAADVARLLLTELGGAVAFQKLRARALSMERYTEVLDNAEASVRQQFEDSIQDARHGYTIATRMDITVFIVGLALLVASATVAVVEEMSLATWASGATGVLAVLYSLFVANPRKQVDEAVDHLMHLKIVFLAYLRQLHQADQVFSRRMLDDEPMTSDDVESFSGIVGSSMLDAITHLRASDQPRGQPSPKQRTCSTSPTSSRCPEETKRQPHHHRPLANPDCSRKCAGSGEKGIDVMSDAVFGGWYIQWS
jgi:hypothetical protein